MKTNIHVNVLINIIRTATLLILSFITFPYVCRVLGDTNLGIYTWANSFVYYFLILARISIPNIATREIVKVKDNPKLLSQKTQEFFIIQAVTTLLSFAIECLILFTVPLFKENQGTVYDYQAIILILSINFLAGVFSFEWIYTALEKHLYTAIRSMIILCIVDTIIFVAIRYPESIALYAACTISVTILTVVSNLIYLPKLVKFYKVERYNFKQYFRPIFILFLITLIIALYEKSDTFVLGFLDESKSSVGDYAVGIKGIEIIIGIITALSGVFMPRATYYVSKKDQQNFINLTKYSANIAFFIVVPAIASMCGMAEPITSLISGSYASEGFLEASNVLIALSSMMLTYSLSNILYTQVLIPLKKEKYYLYALSVGVTLDILLSVLFGLLVFKDSPALGVALATAISDFIVLIILLFLVQKEIKLTILSWNNLKIIAGGIIVFLLAYFLGPYIQEVLFIYTGDVLSRVFELITIVILGGIIYVLFLILTKENLIRSMLKLDRH